MTAAAEVHWTWSPEDVVIRQAYEKERRFIQSTWSRCVRDDPEKMVAVGGKGKTELSARLLLRAHSKLVDDLLISSHVVVAAVRDGDIAMAWMALDPPALHYIFVLPEQRGRGLGGMLARVAKANGAVEPTHMTSAGSWLMGCLR